MKLIHNLFKYKSLGRDTLKRAHDPKIYPNDQPGVYILYLFGRIMKIGCAKEGIRKKMQEYYGVYLHAGSEKHIDRYNRDHIKVEWQYCRESECEELEAKLFKKYGNKPWSDSKPSCNHDTVKLLI